MSGLRFYGVDIDTPLSLAHNTRKFKDSIIGRLNRKTKGHVYIDEIVGSGLKARYGWRVVDAYYSQEDSLMTYFRAYGLDGKSLPTAAFGVHFNDMLHRIGGGFAYRPKFGSEYYVPHTGAFPTPNAGGYTTQILCLDHPSEGIAFGMYPRGKQHQNLIISFRLFELGPAYPNDLDRKIR